MPPGAPACAPNCPHFASCVSGASNEHILDEIGARGAAPRRLQCAIDDECTLTCTLLRFFIQKLGRSLNRVESGFKTHAGGQNARVFAIVRAFSGVVAYVICCGQAFWGVCATTFSANKQGRHLHPHCRAGRLHRGQDAPKKFTTSLPEGQDGFTGGGVETMCTSFRYRLSGDW